MNLWQRKDNHAPPPPLPPAAVLSVVSHWRISVWEGLSVATSPGSLEAVGVQLPWKPHMWQPESLLPKPSASDQSCFVHIPELHLNFSAFLAASFRLPAVQSAIGSRQPPLFVKSLQRVWNRKFKPRLQTVRLMLESSDCFNSHSGTFNAAPL